MEKEKRNYLIDVPVLLLFFTRSECFRKVFEQVRKARPSKLYLCQDGPRNEDDLKGISECRALAESVDWDCEIHRLYMDENVGVDPFEYRAIKWMFEREQYGIIIEDDIVVSPTFFNFAKEMFERYLTDERIGMVCSMNIIGENKACNADYFFSMESPIWGWGTWKRVVDRWDADYTFLKDEYRKKLLNKTVMDKRMFKVCNWHIDSRKEHYESIFWAQKWSDSQLSIAPKKNMVCNIGMGGGSVHYNYAYKVLPKKQQSIMFMEIHDMHFPLTHPLEGGVIRDLDYEKKAGKIMRPCYPVRCMRRIEKCFRGILYKIGFFRK